MAISVFAGEPGGTAISDRLDTRRVPVKVVELELAGRLGARPAAGREPTEGWIDGNVLALVRLHRHPLGLLQADFEDRRGEAAAVEALAEAAHSTFAEAIAAHERSDRDGGSRVNGATPPCLRTRRRVLDAPPAISVVIATRNRPKDLARCLDSVTRVVYPRFEVIVVDNDPSTDATEQLIRDRFAGRVRYTREPVRGLASAHNRGLALASGEIVAFTDDDVVVDRDWLAAIAEAFASGEHVGCVTGLIAPAELDTPAQVMLEAHGGFGKGFRQHRYDLGSPEADPQFPFNAGKWGSGANMAFSAAALRGIGGFDRATGAGSLAKAGDELLSFFQIVVAGYGLVYQPDAVAWHTHPRTQDDLAARAFGHGTGLTAYLTAAVVHEPRMLPALLRRIPRGIGRRLAQPQTPVADGAEVWPRRLSALERRGLAYGPLAYARSRWHLRNVAAAPAALEPSAQNPADVDTAVAPTGAAAPAAEEPAAAPRRRRNPLAVITRGGSLVRTGHLLTLSALLTSVLGAGYWALATRLYSPESVGKSFAAVAALTLLSAIGDLSMGDVLTRFIATAGPHTRRMVLRAYGATTVSTVAFATAFVLLVPHLVPALAFLHSPDVGGAFVVGCAVYTIFALQDGALAGLRKPGCVVVENAAFSVVKIVCLFTIVVATTGILLSWIAALIAAVVGTNAYLFTRAIPRKPAATAAPPTPLLSYTVASYTAALFGIAVVTLPPLLVLNRLGPAQNAYFSLAWIVALALYTLNRSMGISLVVESTWDPGMLRQQILHMIRHTGALVIAGAAVLTAAAPWVLRIFGAAYEHNATGLFRLAVLSAVPDVVVVAASSACRARRRVGLLVAILGGLAVLVLGLTVVLLPVMGIAGIGAAWLIGQTAMAVALIAAHSLWLPPRPAEELAVLALADQRPESTAAVQESAADAEPDDAEPRGAQPVTRWLGMLALPAALGLWIFSLQHVRPERMTDLGLASVLPVTFWVALGILVLGFVATLVRRRTATLWRAGYVLVLGVIMNATPALVYSTLSNGWAWQHVSITDYLAAHGSTAPSTGTLLDAYAQWPGFFALNAFIVRMTGLHSALAYAAWAPLVFNTLMIVPLVVLFRAFTRDSRIVWGGIWLFFVFSWVGQDYFSPQGFGFLLYLVVLAMVVRHLTGGSVPAPTVPDGEATAPTVRPGGRRSLVAFACLLGLLTAATTSAHQLSPLMLVTALAALALPRHRRRDALLAFGIATAVMLAWDATVARPFFKANLPTFLKSFGALDSNARITNTVPNHPSAQQAFIHTVDRGLTVGIILLAVLGALRWRALRRSRLPLLAISPLPWVAASAYGGEITMRVYMFALPPLALFAAAWLSVRPRWRHRLARSAIWPFALVLVMTASLGAGVIGHFGRERTNYLTPDEVAAARYLNAIAPPDAHITTATGDIADVFYPRYVQVLFYYLSADQRRAMAMDPPGELTGLMSTAPGRASYLMLTRAQAADSDMYGLMPRGEVSAIETAVGHAPQFEVVYRNPDAVIFQLKPTSNG